MKKEELESGNKLIAEFMGGGTSEKCFLAPMDKDEINFQEEDYPEKPHDGSCWKFSELKYHSDISWLWPVIIKIESDILDGDVTVNIDGDNCLIAYGTAFEHYVAGMNKIEAVWLAIVKFLEWYNKNK